MTHCTRALTLLLIVGLLAPGLARASYTDVKQYAEDAAHTTGDKGTQLLCVRESTATDLSAGATNGDYEPCQVDASGRVRVTTDTAVAPTNFTPSDGCTLTRLRINISSATTTTLISSIASNYIKIYGIQLRADRLGVATVVTVQDGAATALLGSPFDFAAGDAYFREADPNIKDVTAISQSLQIVTAQAGPVRGIVYYTQCTTAP